MREIDKAIRAALGVLLLMTACLGQVELLDVGADDTGGEEVDPGDEGSGQGDPGDGDGDPGDGDGDTDDGGDGDTDDGGDGDTDDGGDGDGDGDIPDTPELTLDLSAVKQFNFTWTPALGAEYYQLLEKVNPDVDYAQVGVDTLLTAQSLTVPLYARTHASYVLRACNGSGCTDSAPVEVAGSLAEAIGYVKASNPDPDDWFGWTTALSADGRTLAVGALREKSNATGIDGDQADNSATDAGAVYVFARDQQDEWTQQAYVKASNTNSGDYFGSAVTLSADGSTLAVGAPSEDSNAAGVNGDHADNSLGWSGAVYVFGRDGQGQWTQEAYVKASNPNFGDEFGEHVVLSADGDTLAVGARSEDSNATGINGNEADTSASNAGAAYVFVRDDQNEWTQQAYLKASNTNAGDQFGGGVALSTDGSTLAVRAVTEDSNATGINGDQADNSAANAGAVYVFARDDQNQWAQQAYVKAFNTDAGDHFGEVALSANGSVLAVGAFSEDSEAIGVNGDETDNTASSAGAVYVFARDGQDEWSQQAYVKASNTNAGDNFGYALALSADGSTLAVGAESEDSDAIGVDGEQFNNAAVGAGAAYVFVRDAEDEWTQRAYVKASNTNAGDQFAWAIALGADGGTLAIAAIVEDSNATGVGGDQLDNSINSTGAAYLY